MNLIIVHDDHRPRVNGGKGFLGRFRARAWRQGPDIATTWRNRRNVALIAHEVEHDCPDFASNADHHPWWHLCGRSVPVISRRHLHPDSVATARRLIA